MEAGRPCFPGAGAGREPRVELKEAALVLLSRLGDGRRTGTDTVTGDLEEMYASAVAPKIEATATGGFIYPARTLMSMSELVRC